MNWNKLCRPKCLDGLCFKFFEAYNKTMVAKQAWRLIENPSSLVERILHARYYSDEDFMSAEVGTIPSFIWRSILWGRQVIDAGLIWRISNGTSVQVFQDRWIPRPFTLSLLNLGLSPQARVANLLTSFGA
ncbi:PREDICTED: reverse mRNAase [Prunus dulcis]|uniref:PREDICTED: reverse mRNAase n=1 Tax=Prunus dulcis TaxID=3755 RepID=A0A5E4G589_PRUDU|nr:hypothetical protein L3X38_026021 [Prunus dulcis]VVA34949.1 PREDICTED: reverse mRNAase [Prunus dulcis]